MVEKYDYLEWKQESNSAPAAEFSAQGQKYNVKGFQIS